MRMRIEWLDPGLALPPELWFARTDQAIWTVTPSAKAETPKRRNAET